MDSGVERTRKCVKCWRSIKWFYISGRCADIGGVVCVVNGYACYLLTG